MRQPKGTLELTWTDKDLALLSHGGNSYEWVDPSDYRVSEVHLLHETGAVGDGHDNLLIQGDAMHVLTSLISLPDYAKRYVGKVKLCYIDPPFNTKQAFRTYEDNLEISVWLTLLRDRLVQIHQLMSDDGTIWLHLDDRHVHRARCILDEVFGDTNYISTVVWEKKKKPSFLHGQMASVTDYILVFGKDRSQVGPFTIGTSKAGKGTPFHNKGNSVGVLTFPAGSVLFRVPDGRYAAGDMSSDTIESSLLDDVVVVKGRNVSEFRMKGEWRFSQDALDAMVGSGDVIDIARSPFRPNRKTDATKAKKITNLFSFHINDVPTNEDAKEEIRLLLGPKSDFDTPKPEALIERVVEAATSEGDIVLDCFAGSGTTAAVAHKMGRQWVTVELSPDNVERFVLPRLTKVVDGADPGGITASQGWKGGGGFTVEHVGPSMFETTDSGRVVLAEWATGGELAEAVAAQVGYDFKSEGPFAGRRGRSRLAVIDGVLGLDVATYLVEQLAERETLLVVAQAVEPGVAEKLRQMRRGSRVRKVPRDLAKIGLGPSRVVQLPAPAAPFRDNKGEAAEAAEVTAP